MPFIAIDKVTRQRIDILKIENPRVKLQSGKCVCQLCGEPLIVRIGPSRRPHFAHYANCVSEYHPSHEETPEHLFAKREIRRLLTEKFASDQNIVIDYEVPIPEIKRIADVLVTFPMGWRVAHEIQLSGISPDDLKERTDDYLSAGIDVIWWLGKAADNEHNRNWCVRNFGFSLFIDFRTDRTTQAVSVSQYV